MSGLHIDRARAAVRMPVDQAEQLVEHEALALAERRLRRQPRGRHGQQHRCQSCNHFMASRAGACGSCGYTQGRGWVQ